jgi:cbb3-type cytochrome oxidase subunit 3
MHKGAVAGVFIAVALALLAIIAFVLFAFRRRRRKQRDREASIAAALAESSANQRYTPEGIRARTRSPWPDDEDDEDGMMYHTGAAPVMYSNLNGVGPPTQNMQTTQTTPFPVAPVAYIPARASSRSPSPTLDPMGLPSTGMYTALPHPSRRSDSISPAPSANALTAANHGSGTLATSMVRNPSPGSAGNRSAGNGSGSAETAVPNAPTPIPPSPHPGSPPLENIYPPAYEQFAENSPQIGVAFEPTPVQHNHQITVGLPDVQGYDATRASEDAMGVTNASMASRSIYSQDGSEDWVEHDPARFEDHRIDPMMRMQGALVSAASVGPRDHEDWMRRVMVRNGFVCGDCFTNFDTLAASLCS